MFHDALVPFAERRIINMTQMEHLIQGTEREYIEETDTGADVITQVAPLVKPEQTKEMVQTVIEKEEKKESRV